MDQFEPFEFKEDWQEVGEREKHETYFQVQINIHIKFIQKSVWTYSYAKYFNIWNVCVLYCT